MKVYNAMGQEVDASGLQDQYGRPLATLDYPGRMAEAQHGIVGYVGQDSPENAERFRNYVKVPAQYVINIILSGDPASPRNIQTGGVQLRPEPFVLKRITWASDGDVPYSDNVTEPENTNAASIVGRVTEMEWQDEFTRFMGDRRGFISAVLGDSEGFLDLPRPALFQGKQTLSIRLRMTRWPWVILQPEEYPDIRYDFVLHGLGLLPPGAKDASGSAG